MKDTERERDRKRAKTDTQKEAKLSRFLLTFSVGYLVPTLEWDSGEQAQVPASGNRSLPGQ